MRKNLLLSLAFLLGLGANAQYSSYYQSVAPGYGATLKTSLSEVIRPHTERSYSQLWDDFRKTDARSDGKVWDMYSNITNYTFGKDQAGNTGAEGTNYNREHSFPKSWFKEQKPMYSDLFHLYPTDTKINGMRSNYPFGENNGDKGMSQGGFSKLGTCTTPGYNGTVFEPNNEYKGDFARTYFYMVTAYEKNISSWRYQEGGMQTLDGNTYPGLKKWQLDMLMRWAKQDPVSDKEIKRNNAVYGIQHNRNPFIDFPGLEVYVWGDSAKQNVTVDLKNYKNPYHTGGTTTPDEPIVTPDEPAQPTDTTTTTPDVPGTGGDVAGGSNVFVKATSTADLTAGRRVIFVYEQGSLAMSSISENTKYFTGADISISGNTVTLDAASTDVNIFTIGKAGSNFTFVSAGNYLYYAPNTRNTLGYATEVTDATQWSVSFDGGTTVTNVKTADRQVQYNTSSPRFSSYTGGQKPIALYVERAVETAIQSVSGSRKAETVIYDLTGRRVKHAKKGLYIVNGKKVLVK